jgi:hypothetical protein
VRAGPFGHHRSLPASRNASAHRVARLALRALLHQDLGHVAEAERELADITAFQPESPFAVWLEQRLDLA